VLQTLTVVGHSVVTLTGYIVSCWFWDFI